MIMQIIFNGIKYYRNTSTGYYSKARRGLLHRDVWEHHNGPIPEGHHIHHIDGNKDNNSIDNLELKAAHQHASDHMTPEKREQARVCMNLHARPEAIKWHKSQEGNDWHKEHFEESLRKSIETMVTKTCEICNKEYEVNTGCEHKSRFCSNNCKSKFRRRSKADNITKQCPVCDKEFNTCKYKGSETCSRECGTKLRIYRRNGIHWLK